MACKISSLLLTHVFILSILFAIAGQAIAARLGRVLLPLGFKHHNPHIIGIGTHTGSSGGHFGSTIGGNRQIPGGDDTFVLNPCFEVPIPTGCGAGIARTNPRP
ncbi:hypothetical protein ES319_A12G145800v1 [Gossypium barbadense]|uniref:Uncharacterized protein n=2 Tax=Gossypium TaxID=3633 RepID=A0A2P5YF38_GOSBA|nr:hypothetical protein ES319_A12G145800v1 [Gossypium barbadense]PPS14154.1 hypothetical protein GOBAR_AA06408 [Gossypium barbadense]TYG90142.1 hypothetical protein ES288_A12G158700v1 [Gossypium darwinii]